MFILIAIVTISSVIQLFFWAVQLDSLYRQKSQFHSVLSSSSVSATLVVAVKNELDNIKHNLDLWLKQDYPNLNIIIVNDHSNDGTWSYLQAIYDDRLHLINLPEGKTSKKQALTEGIASSTSEWIITTDADCSPQSDSWISHLMAHAHDADIVLGYSPHISKDGWLGQWIDYETWYIAIQYLSAVLMGRPYMSVGRNVAFKKEQFDQVGGFVSHMHVRSGDDDLLINEIGSKARYSIAVSRDAWVWTEAKNTWGTYIQQKRRHLSTAPHYNLGNQVWLMVVYMSQLIWYGAVIYMTILMPIYGVLFLLRWMVLMIVAYRSKQVLGLKVRTLFVPVFDFLLCLFYGFMSFTLIKKKEDW